MRTLINQKVFKVKSSIFFLIIYSIVILSSCETNNESPTISNLSASPSIIETEGYVTITCEASDPDGDNLSYLWESISGIIDGNGSEITWVSPNTAGTYSISCEVTDNNNGHDIKAVNVNVIDNNSEETLLVNAMSNCIFLDNSDAAHIDLAENNYTVSVTDHTAAFKSGELFSHIYLSCAGNVFNLLDLNSSILIEQANERGVYAFFTDTYSLNDNSGSVTLLLNPIDGGVIETLQVNAFENCILLDNSDAAHIDLTDSNYTVTVANHTASYKTGEFFSHIYLSCAGNVFNLLDLNSSILIEQASERGVYAFFTDTYNLSDNSGSLILNFNPVD